MAAERVCIIGAGPCGLACADELTRLGHEDHVVYEATDRPGGLASSVVDAAGFTWDHGGHVVFSHYGEFDRLLESTMGDEVHHHQRSSYVRVAGCWVPYPFQQNLHRLPAELTVDCLAGLIEAPGGRVDDDFSTWMTATFGLAITEVFMGPYNTKVWATDPREMSATWIAERVSVPDWRRALRTVVTRQDDAGWGPNNTFGFPTTGGTGEIYRRLADRLGDTVRFGQPVVSVDAGARRLDLADGTSSTYGTLVSTMPLDRLVASIVDAPSPVRNAAAGLRHNSVFVVGVGIQGPLRDDRSWLYFPEPDIPFYRATNFAKYAAANVPDGDVARYRSFMTEVAYSPEHPVDRGDLAARVVAALIEVGLLDPGEPVVSTEVIDVPYAYPVPTRDRDDRLAVIQPWLEAQGVWSRGRFGSWRYEHGNMDHTVKMGVDAARRIVHGSPEELAGP